LFFFTSSLLQAREVEEIDGRDLIGSGDPLPPRALFDIIWPISTGAEQIRKPRAVSAEQTIIKPLFPFGVQSVQRPCIGVFSENGAFRQPLHRFFSSRLVECRSPPAKRLVDGRVRLSPFSFSVAVASHLRTFWHNTFRKTTHRFSTFYR
jgi:hypothetical protein